MVWLERQRITVVVVAHDAAVRAQLAGGEQPPASGVGDDEAEPGAARRIRRRQLVARGVRDGDLDLETPVADLGARNRQRRGFRPQQLQRSLARQAQLLRQRRDAQLGRISFQHAQHEEVGALKSVAREPPARLAEHAGRRRRLGRERHVARLAGLLARVGAGPPFQIRHLLGEWRDRLVGGARPVQRRGVKRVAGRTELGGLDVGRARRTEAGRAVHDVRARRRDVVRAVHQPVPPRAGACRSGSRRRAPARDRRFAAGGTASTTRRRSPSGSPSCVKISPCPPGGARLKPRHRHVTGGAFVFDARGGVAVVDGLAPDGGLPVGIPRGVGHDRRAPRETDRDVLAGRRGHAVVARQAAIRGGEQRRGRRGRRRGATAVAAAAIARRTTDGAVAHVYQPASGLPSYQSHSRYAPSCSGRPSVRFTGMRAPASSAHVLAAAQRHLQLRRQVPRSRRRRWRAARAPPAPPPSA